MVVLHLLLLWTLMNSLFCSFRKNSRHFEIITFFFCYWKIILLFNITVTEGPEDHELNSNSSIFSFPFSFHKIKIPC